MRTVVWPFNSRCYLRFNRGLLATADVPLTSSPFTIPFELLWPLVRLFLRCIDGLLLLPSSSLPSSESRPRTMDGLRPSSRLCIGGGGGTIGVGRSFLSWSVFGDFLSAFDNGYGTSVSRVRSGGGVNGLRRSLSSFFINFSFSRHTCSWSWISRSR